MTHRIVISEFMDEPAVERLRAVAEVVYEPDLADRPGDLLALAADADALIVRNRTQVRGALLDALTKARVIGRLGVGLDNIDLGGAEARGITVIPATGANAVAVAEYVMAAALLLVRKAYDASAEVIAGSWPRQRLGDGGELFGRTLGLVGFGGIAREVAVRARAFGMPLLGYDPLIAPDDPVWVGHGARPVDLDALVAESDIVSLHLPLTDETRGLFEASRIAAMRPGAVLINTARGGIVDEAALGAALASGRLGGAAIDVFGAEPLLAGSPLAEAPNLLATPHIAGVTVEANRRVSALIADRVLEALAR